MKFPFRFITRLNRTHLCTDLIPKQVYAYSTSGSDPVDLSYSSFQQHGKSDNQPLVMIHGMFGAKKNFESLAKAFSMNTNRQVITVDVRNHGNSPHVAEMDYHSMVGDMERLLQNLGIDKAITLGHSMGGKIAMVMALTKPHLVSKLIVEDVSPTVSRLGGSTALPEYFSAMRNITFDQSATTLADVRKDSSELLKDVFPDVGVRNFMLTNIEKNDKYCWRINLDAIEANLDVLVSFPRLDTSYSLPVLFIGGSQSEHIREANYPDIKRLFPAVEIKHVKDAGHWVHSEKPYVFMDMVIDFIKDS